MHGIRPVGRQAGFALPAVLIVLLGLGLLVASGFHSANLELEASRSLAASIRAFQGAEAGMALLESGSRSDSVREIGDAVSLVATIDTLWISAEGPVLLRRRIRAIVSDPGGRTLARRQLERLWLLQPGGTTASVPGGWSESIRPGP
jgi:Tfp pilus assembly protein PilX